MFNWLLHIASIVGLVLGLVRRAVRAVEAPGGNAEAALMASLRQRYPEAPQPWLDLVARNSMLAASAFAESAAKPPVRPEFIPQRQETEPRREGSFRVVSEMPSIERPRFADVPGRARPTWRWRVIEEDRPLVAVRAERDTTPRTVPRARFHEAIATDVEAARFDVPRDLELPHQGFETRDETAGLPNPVEWSDPDSVESDMAMFGPPLSPVETELVAFEREVALPLHERASFRDITSQSSHRPQNWTDEPGAELWPALPTTPTSRPTVSTLAERVQRLKQIQARR